MSQRIVLEPLLEIRCRHRGIRPARGALVVGPPRDGESDNRPCTVADQDPRHRPWSVRPTVLARTRPIRQEVTISGRRARALSRDEKRRAIGGRLSAVSARRLGRSGLVNSPALSARRSESHPRDSIDARPRGAARIVGRLRIRGGTCRPRPTPALPRRRCDCVAAAAPRGPERSGSKRVPPTTRDCVEDSDFGALSARGRRNV